MRFICNLLLLFFLSAVTMSFNFFNSKRDYCDMAKEIRSKVGKTLAKRHNMDCIGVGGGMMGSVYMIGLSFQIHHPIDQEEARWLIVDCAEELLKTVNENEEIRPFLKNFPFTVNNIQIEIYSNYLDGRQVFDPSIRVSSIFNKDEISFFTKEPNRSGYKNKYYEPYQEALAWVNERKASKTTQGQCSCSKHDSKNYQNLHIN